jgi:hypothetical protein
VFTGSAPPSPRVRQVVSGGQTGVDRAALDVGRRLGIPVGGWCPAGGWAEDQPDPPGILGGYPELRPTPSADPDQRTRWNVRDSTATLVLADAGTASPGTAATVAAARELARPHLVVPVDVQPDIAEVIGWLASLQQPVVLNVAGPRESEAPGIYELAGAFLEALLGAAAA